MAVRGRKPKPTHLHLIEGTHRSDRHHDPETEPLPEGAIEKPEKLRRAPNSTAARLWDKFIARAFWLSWADGPKAYVWCALQAEFEKAPGKMQSSRIAQLRALGSELGLDPASRARLGADKDPGGEAKQTNPAAKYLS